jgi:DNA-binding MarR family transcriptional regulator
MDGLRILAALRRIDHALEVQSRRSDRENGLTMPQMLVLAQLRDLAASARENGRPFTIKTLATRVALSAATTLVIVDRLEEKGLVARQRSREDRRAVETRLTEAGERALANGASPLPRGFAERLDALPLERRTALIGAVEDLAALMQDDDAAAAEAAPAATNCIVLI